MKFYMDRNLTFWVKSEYRNTKHRYPNLKRWEIIAGILSQLENVGYASRYIRKDGKLGWRATDEPSYPGVLLWMMRSEPEGRLALTAEPFTREVYCSWPITCRSGKGAGLSLPAKAACALRAKLLTQHMRTIGEAQAGPKENDDEGLPSVWFEYDDGKHFLRQAVAVADAGDRAVGLVLEASSNDQRSSAVRPFEQALRTLRPLSIEELAAAPLPAPVSAGSDVAISDAGGIVDADIGSGSAATTSSGSGSGSDVSAPSGLVAPRSDPTGPCS